ncbi:MAG: hypothetical protein COB81_05210 [Flavobacteriaceae bacterium]|nr:MAG: hypothetical protein COB81_05210 [Flavobacteriaceae bacterium]
MEKKRLGFSAEEIEEIHYLTSEFFNNISHEIRTPMHAILGFSELLNVSGISEIKRMEFVDVIQRNGQQLLDVVGHILKISELATKQIIVLETEVCLNDLMFELFLDFKDSAEEKKIQLYLNTPLSGNLSTIITDNLKLNKILRILLENALKYTNGGIVEFGYKLENKKILIYIKDTGVGIEKSKHITIFKPFSKAKIDLSKNTSGLGLGLSIALENVKLLGGRLHVDSEKGKGATFFVTLPYKYVFVEEV